MNMMVRARSKRVMVAVGAVLVAAFAIAGIMRPQTKSNAASSSIPDSGTCTVFDGRAVSDAEGFRGTVSIDGQEFPCMCGNRADGHTDHNSWYGWNGTGSYEFIRMDGAYALYNVHMIEGTRAPGTSGSNGPQYLRFKVLATGNVRITKTFSNQAASGNGNYSVANATYELYSDAACTNSVASFSTDGNGESEADGITAGDYFLKETGASAGCKINTEITPVTVSAGETTYVNGSGCTVEQPIMVTLTLNKSNAENGAAITTGGFKFALYRDDNSDGTPDGDVLQTIEIASGQSTATFTDAVTLGHYLIKETDTAVPYNVTTREVDATQGGNTADFTVNTEFKDYPQYGRATITKTDSEDGALQAGASYEVIALQDVTYASQGDASRTAADYPVAETTKLKTGSASTDADGKVTVTNPITFKNADGSTFKDITTGADGKATTGYLPIGSEGSSKYAFVEVKTSDGHVLDGTPIEFTLTYKAGVSDHGSADEQAVTQKDVPNEIAMSKQALTNYEGTDTSPVVGATFRIWNCSDELSLTPQSGLCAWGMRINSGSSDDMNHKVVLYQQISGVIVSMKSGTAAGYTVKLSNNVTGDVYTVSDGSETAFSGNYTIHVYDKDGNEQAFNGDTTVALKEGNSYVYNVEVGGITGKLAVSVDNTETGDRSPLVAKANGIYESTAVKPNSTYAVEIDGKAVNMLTTDAAGSVMWGRYSTTKYPYSYKSQPTLLKSDSDYISSFTYNGTKYDVPTTTDDKGVVNVKRIAFGEYGFGETDIPVSAASRSFLINTNVFHFTVDSTTGRISATDADGGENAFAKGNETENTSDGGQTDSIDKKKVDSSLVHQGTVDSQLTDKTTRMTISKSDITGAKEVVGATLQIRDSTNKVIAQWTSDGTKHTVTGIAPGTYTLVEYLTPSNYGQATRISFTVSEVGEIQKVAMSDEQLHISGKLDKRQEIADPTVANTVENGDGKNTADVTQSNDGLYDYSLDYENTSDSWTDEYTVEDPLDGVSAGYTRLNSITTPQAYEDYDGKLNVWYQTNMNDKDDTTEAAKANATTSDKHDNPLITGDTRTENSKTNDPDGDGRVLSYTGWKLWQADVSAIQATHLDVSALGLKDGEYVTAVRFEYGRVEKGFTTRNSDWDRTNLKDEHDDVNDVEFTHTGTFDVSGLKAEEANVSVMTEFAYDYLTDADKAEIKVYQERIAEAIDAQNTDAEVTVSKCISGISDIVSARVKSIVSSSSVTDSKSLDKASTKLHDAYNKVKSTLTSDATARMDSALAEVESAVDSGDPVAIESVRKDLDAATDTILAQLKSSSNYQDGIHYASAVMHMQLTDAYVDGVNLDNSAHVDLYRNGGGEGLEGHDSDKVTQTPKERWLKTTATDKLDGDKSVNTKSNSEITDAVEYHGLDAGKTYTLDGNLHLKNADGTDAGVATDAAGKSMSGSVTFTPTSSDGVVNVDIKLDASKLNGKDMVVFETATDTSTGKVVATHADITDQGQTVNIRKQGLANDEIAKTGDDAMHAIVAGIIVTAAIAAGAYAWRRHRLA